MNTKASPAEWVGRLIDKRFPLFEWLASAESGELFRTELPGSPAQKAAIRLVPAEIEGVQSQFDDWAQAEGLSHPHLLRIFESGRGRIDENELLYVVMEFPEETLAQVLPTRTLTGPEAAEMLPPIIDALGYLHARGLVHGHITPANVLVVEDRVKLSADTLQQSGRLRKLQGGLRIYDAPEVAQGTIAPASDLWSLGITLVEALTQLPPIRTPGSSEPGVPQFMPEPFATIARRCLRVDPAARASLEEIQALLRVPANRTAAVPPTAPVASSGPRPGAPVVRAVASIPNGALPAGAAQPSAPTPRPQPAQVPDARPEPLEAASDQVRPSPRAMRSLEDEGETTHSGLRSKPSMPLIVGLAALLLVLIAALFIRSRRSEPVPAVPTPGVQTGEPSASAPAPAPVAHAPAPKPAAPRRAAPSGGPSAKGAVAERVMPQVPERAARTIHGKVTVRVRLTVDAQGNVSNASFESAGPSRYFANLALQAARKWRFRPAEANGQPAPSTWILRFDFRRDGAEVNPVESAR